jgi:hypothetical protein
VLPNLFGSGILEYGLELDKKLLEASACKPQYSQIELDEFPIIQEILASHRLRTTANFLPFFIHHRKKSVKDLFS